MSAKKREMMMMEETRTYKLLVHSASQVVCVVDNGVKTMTKDSMNCLSMLTNDGSDGICIVVGKDGNIIDIGRDSLLKSKYVHSCEKIFDATGLCIIPGLVDGHTHPVWAGDRVHEFAMKLAGASYMDIHKAGGGIGFTVAHTREASEDELFELFKSRMQQLLKSGVTLVECKSGYGLDYETELKMLRVINRGITDPEVKCDISVTYCGAHSVPEGKTAEQATEEIITSYIPSLRGLCESGQLTIHNIDVFCEKGVFDVQQTKRILQAGQACGWNVNFHAEELNCLHSAEMGAELGALAMSHLEEVSDEGIKLMSKHGSVATVLPTTAYLLRLNPPPVRKLIDEGVIVALGTDFNPNAYCLSMPLVMNLACVTMKMTMNEALCAATINSAYSLNSADTHGSIEVGKKADLVLLDAPRWEHLIYQIGGHDSVIRHVVKNGEFVYSRD